MLIRFVIFLCCFTVACGGRGVPSNSGSPSLFGFQPPDSQVIQKSDAGIFDQQSLLDDLDNANYDSQTGENASTEEIDASDSEDEISDEEIASEDVIFEILEQECQDEDGDEFGENCEKGLDCDDGNPNFNLYCPDCKKDNYPGCVCSGKSAPCYNFDVATKGVGICKVGSQACKAGIWQQCIGETGPSVEVCDNKDNDCDGETDENVKSTCGTCDLTCVQKTVGSLDNPFVINSENSSGVGLDQQGQIVIDSKQISLNLKFIWIANSPQNTVSKVDCKTIQEVGRYPVCSDPSRTSVDLDGNVWVACRGDGQVAKIMAEKKNCDDKNGNGIIETSAGSQVVPNDECVKFIVQPNKGTYARGAAVDKFNNVWIGYWNSKSMVQLSAKDGATLKDVDLGCSPYGLVIDQKGLIWGQGAGCNSLILYNPETGQLFTSSNMPSLKYPSNAYGLNVDSLGRIWVSGGGTASVYSPGTGTWQVINMGWGGGRGVATSNDGFVYVAVDSSGGAVKINGMANPPQVVGFIKGAGNPVGAALDYDGFVWVVNQGGSSATKLDPKTMTAVGTVPVGSSPYTYSDMTGYTLNYFTAPKGQYNAVFFATGVGNPVSQTKSKAVWQSITINGQFPPMTHVDLQVRAANTKDDLESAQWVVLSKVDSATVMPISLTTIAPPLFGLMLQVQINLVTESKKVSPSISEISAKAKLQ